MGDSCLGRTIIEDIELLVKSMNGLQVELSGFRSEMKEFKKVRIDELTFRYKKEDAFSSEIWVTRV